MSTIVIPSLLRTARLLLQRWQPLHAARLLPLLEENEDHLLPWIPPQVALAAPEPELSVRLGGYSTDFDAGRAWRYGLFSHDEAEVYGEVSLFPRSEEGRVLMPDADRVEIGYWLRSDTTGRGLATEAAQAMLSLARTLPQIRLVEIRCDARNLRSAAIPRRLGFQLASLLPRPSADGSSCEHDMVWQFLLSAE